MGEEKLKIAVHIMPRPEALDPQGRAVQGALKRLGFEVAGCRVGKTVVVDVNEESKDRAVEKARQMADKLLCNPLIETYEVEPL
jgi:phosphoribosylformylglycinamidine synthase subunit PurS